MTLAGAHALVTGGGSGVGLAVARALAGAGAAVTITGRRAEVLDQAAAETPGLHAAVADVTDPDGLAALVAAITDARGAPGIVIANAGAADSTPAARLSTADWDRMIAVNLSGVFHTFRACLPAMLTAGRGRLIAIASTAGLKGYPYVAAYCAAKHGVVGLVRALGVELARTGVTANAICPGFTATPLLERSLDTIAAKTGRTRAEAADRLVRDMPIGRFIRPEEVAAAVLYLAGPGSDAVTGTVLSVSGGET